MTITVKECHRLVYHKQKKKRVINMSPRWHVETAHVPSVAAQLPAGSLLLSDQRSASIRRFGSIPEPGEKKKKGKKRDEHFVFIFMQIS